MGDINNNFYYSNSTAERYNWSSLFGDWDVLDFNKIRSEDGTEIYVTVIQERSKEAPPMVWYSVVPWSPPMVVTDVKIAWIGSPEYDYLENISMEAKLSLARYIQLRWDREGTLKVRNAEDKLREAGVLK